MRARLIDAPTVIQFTVPDGLCKALRNAFCEYTEFHHLFHCLHITEHCYIGVAGDGDNGAYEWFVWNADTQSLKTSDNGFGDSDVALRMVLNTEVA